MTGAAPAHGRFYTYVLNNIDVVITIIFSQKYDSSAVFVVDQYK